MKGIALTEMQLKTGKQETIVLVYTILLSEKAMYKMLSKVYKMMTSEVSLKKQQQLYFSEDNLFLKQFFEETILPPLYMCVFFVVN